MATMAVNATTMATATAMATTTGVVHGSVGQKVTPLEDPDW